MGGTADLREGLCADEQCLAVPILAHNSPNSRMARAARNGYEAFVYRGAWRRACMIYQFATRETWRVPPAANRDRGIYSRASGILTLRTQTASSLEQRKYISVAWACNDNSQGSRLRRPETLHASRVPRAIRSIVIDASDT
jgi:hypothetical protein